MPSGVYDRSKSKPRPRKTKAPKEQPVTDTYETPADDEAVEIPGTRGVHLNYAQYFDAFEILEAIERTYREHGIDVPDGFVIQVPIPDTNVVGEGVYESTAGVWTLAPFIR